MYIRTNLKHYGVNENTPKYRIPYSLNGPYGPDF